MANRQNFLSICVSLIFIGSFVYAVFSFNNSLHENFKRNGKYESIEFAHQKAMDKIVVESEKVMGINEYQCGFECQKQKNTDSKNVGKPMMDEDFKAENLHQVIDDNDDISRIVQKVEDDPFRFF